MELHSTSLRRLQIGAVAALILSRPASCLPDGLRPTPASTPPTPAIAESTSSSRERWKSCTRTGRTAAACITTSCRRTTERGGRWTACRARDRSAWDRQTGCESTGRLARGPGRRAAAEHVWLAENHRDPGELLERSAPSRTRSAQAQNRVRGGRRLVPRSLVPADVARHRRRRLVHVAGHQRELRLSPASSPRRDKPRPPPASTSRRTCARSTPSRSTPTASSPGWRSVGGNPSSVWINGKHARASSPMSSDTPSASIIRTPSTVIPPS